MQQGKVEDIFDTSVPQIAGNIVEVMRIVSQECVPKRICEQISDVAVPPIQEVIVVVTQPNPQDCISVRIADLLVPQTQERDVEAVNATAQERVQYQPVGQFVDVLFHLVLDEIAEVIIDEPFAAVPVLRIQEHIAMQIDEQVVDVPATTSQEQIAESLRLNPQDRISDCIDEQIVLAPLNQDEKIEMNLQENDELVQRFLRKCSSEDITVSPPSARAKKKGEGREWLRAVAVPGATCIP